LVVVRRLQAFEGSGSIEERRTAAGDDTSSTAARIARYRATAGQPALVDSAAIAGAGSLRWPGPVCPQEDPESDGLAAESRRNPESRAKLAGLAVESGV
jgi:hypothetical protein